MREGVRGERVVSVLKMVRSIQHLMEKPGGVVLVVCSPASFLLSYTSNRIPAIRIITIFPPRGTEESWDDISNLVPRRDFLLIRHVPWHETCFTVDGGDGGAYSPSHRGAGQIFKKTGRDRLTPSTAVRLQDGRTAPLRTLVSAIPQI